MNFPVNATKEADYDLKFSPRMNAELTPKLIISRGAQQASTKPGKHRQASAYISAYDYGAYGKFKVFATVEEKQYESQEYLLPKRSGDSKIADAWYRQFGGGIPNDTFDGESTPGNSNDGDGLTQYEEYRGFVERGRHVRGNPLAKDYFVCDAINTDTSRAGIDLFAKVSGLKVHVIDSDEFVSVSEGAWINFNFSEKHAGLALHRTNQKGAILLSAVIRGDTSGQTPPGTKSSIINKYYLNSLTDRDRVKETIAHELLHGTGVEHHGLADTDVTWALDATRKQIVEKGPDGAAVPITVKFENGGSLPARDFPEVFGESQKVILGSWSGAESGAENCVMRYWVARAYVSNKRGEENVRYYILRSDGLKRDPPPRDSLCDSKVGTGNNAPSHPPQPRFGDATRGNCKSQIRVKD
jgi:hypothetical protein